MNSFAEIGLAAPILAALDSERHSTPTPIQAKAIPQILTGRDLIGIAQTGTGKTAAFTLPMLDRLARNPVKGRQPKTCRALILAPTRELANQIDERVRAYGRRMSVTTAIVIGGQSIRAQARAIAPGVDIVIATPGRLIDLLGSNAINLSAVEMMILDEADRMLDMGFIRPIRDIAARLPAGHQSIFFSATMPPPIADLASTLLSDPVTVLAAPVAKTADRIDQRIVFVGSGQKSAILGQMLTAPDVSRALVFARTKRGADRIVKNLATDGIQSQAIHGNKTQQQRERALHSFRRGNIRVLVATDIAARGIDIPDISHVVNYDLPMEAESYVHRIGRTARAGTDGIAISLCGEAEHSLLRSIEKLIRQAIPVMTVDGFVAPAPIPTDAVRPAKQPAKPARGKPRRYRGKRNGAAPADRPHRAHPANRPANRSRPAKGGGRAESHA